MARIALIGGHGKVALELQPLLVAAGHEVSAVIRNPDQREDVEATGATPVIADVEHLDTTGLTELLTGHDVVIWAAGAGGGSPERTQAVDRDAAIRSIDAAQAAGVKQYLMVSYFGARPDHGVPAEQPFSVYADAKAAADAHLCSSRLQWTILAPSGLTLQAPTGRIELAGPGIEGGQVPRADVAAVIAAVVGRDDLAGVTVTFNTGDVSIKHALDSLAG
ncbi:MAG: NAD(P)H-binding protein [Dermatophilaceae bacterium]